MSRLDRIALLIAHVLVVGLAGCGGDGSDASSSQGSEAPAPVPAPSPAPGPAPAPATYSVSLSWSPPLFNTDGTSLTDLNSYQISYGTNAGDLNQQMSVNGSATSATVAGLSAGTYYFSLRTVNAAGVASGASGVVSQSVP